MTQHLCEFYSNRFVCDHLDDYNIWLIAAKKDFVMSVDNMCSFQWDQLNRCCSSPPHIMIVSTQKNHFILLYVICLDRFQHILVLDLVPLDCIYILFDRGMLLKQSLSF
jgi:hypothetical protein